jgi:hypothetical protein
MGSPFTRISLDSLLLKSLAEAPKVVRQRHVKRANLQTSLTFKKTSFISIAPRGGGIDPVRKVNRSVMVCPEAISNNSDLTRGS